MPAQQQISPEFVDLYDAERARVLRRRAIAYCVTVLALVAISGLTSVIDLLFPSAFEGPLDVTGADILTDTLFLIVYAAALIDFVRHRRSRAEIVRRFQWIVAVAGLIAVAVTPLVMNATWFPGASLDHTPESDFAQGLATLFTVFILHFLASLFVALSPREGLLPFLPIITAFVAWLLLVSACTLAQRTTLSLAAPLAGAPGLTLGWWRYRSFAHRFHARAVLNRYAEVSRDLTDARRVHEALFPPPITRGPVRVAYRYEPMRQIGGDFLFIRPLAFPPSPPDGPILIVLIDVTGHGIAAAIAVNRIHDELQRCTRATLSLAPAHLLTHLNTFVHNALAPQSVFASAFCVHLTPPDAQDPARLRWAGAGHPPALLRAADGSIRRLDSTAPMLGAIEPVLFTCDHGELEFQQHDTLLAYTDGATEATNAAGEQLRIDGLEQRLASTTAPRGEVADALAHDVHRFRHGPTTDDVLIVELSLARRNSSRPEQAPAG